MAVITIGSPAINRPSSQDVHTLTQIDKGGPASGTGKITQIQTWVNTAFVDLQVATFFVVSGNNLSTRSIQALGAQGTGLKTLTVDLDVVAGDYIGLYDGGPAGTGHVEFDMPGGSTARWFKTGDQIPCTNAAFTSIADSIFSLYGTGKTLGGPKSNPSLILIGHGGI